MEPGGEGNEAEENEAEEALALLDGADVQFVNERSVVRWLVARGKADAVRRRLSTRKQNELLASFRLLADTPVDESRAADGKKPTISAHELRKALELLGVDAADDERSSRDARALLGPAPAAAAEDAPERDVGFDEFVQMMMQRQSALSSQQRGAHEQSHSVFDVFPLMAKAYEVRRLVDRAGAPDAKKRSPSLPSKAVTGAARRSRDDRASRHSRDDAAAVHHVAARKRSSTRSELPSAPRRASSMAALPADASVPALSAAEMPSGGAENGMMTPSSATTPTNPADGDRRSGIFWETFNATNLAYSQYKRLRDEYESRWLGKGGEEGDGGAGEPAVRQTGEDELADVYLTVSRPEELDETDLAPLTDGMRHEDGGGGHARRRVVGGPMPRSLAQLGTAAAISAASRSADGAPTAGGRAGGRMRISASAPLLAAGTRGRAPSGQIAAPGARGGAFVEQRGLAASTALLPGSEGGFASSAFERREPLLPTHAARYAARSRVLPSLELPDAGVARRAPMGARETPPLAHVEPARNARAGRAAMAAKVQAWHDMRESTRENGPIRAQTLQMGRSLRLRERVYLGYTNPMPIVDDGVFEFFS